MKAVSTKNAKLYARLFYAASLICCIVIAVLMLGNWQTIVGVESISLMKMSDNYGIFGPSLLAIFGVSMQALLLVIMLVLFRRPSNGWTCFFACITFVMAAAFIIGAFVSPGEVFLINGEVPRVPSATPYIICVLSVLEAFACIKASQLLKIAEEPVEKVKAPTSKKSAADLVRELNETVESEKKD